MVFYTKHIAELLKRAGADPSPRNKELLDKAVREVLDMERANANDVWERVKEIMFSGNNETKKKEFEDEVVRLMIKHLITG